MGVEEIERLFHGRRHATRTVCVRQVDVSGPEASFRGRTVNVSRLGALVAIHDERFLPAGATGSLMEVAAAARAAFPETVRIRFRRARVAVNAAVVRVAGHPADASGVLGCRFESPLTLRQCRAIGIVPDARGDRTPRA